MSSLPDTALGSYPVRVSLVVCPVPSRSPLRLRRVTLRLAPVDPRSRPSEGVRAPFSGRAYVRPEGPVWIKWGRLDEGHRSRHGVGYGLDGVSGIVRGDKSVFAEVVVGTGKNPRTVDPSPPAYVRPTSQSGRGSQRTRSGGKTLSGSLRVPALDSSPRPAPHPGS